MQKTCTQCPSTFTIREEDKKFYDQMSPIFGGQKYALPEPSLCPICRQIRRFVFRNERALYRSSCDFSKKSILSMYSPEKNIPTYAVEAWWSDKWDATEYGRDIDFSRPFFEQYKELMAEVPHLNLINDSVSPNSEFVNQTGHVKNCYLVFDSDYDEDCYYSQTIKQSRSSMDCLDVLHSELVYEVSNGHHNYHVFFAEDSHHCRDSYFLKNCRGLKNCFGCVNLVNKEYCFFNEQLTKEAYEKKLATIDLGSRAGLAKAHTYFENWAKQFPVKENHNGQTEASHGDYLENTKEAYLCFDAAGLENCAYATRVFHEVKDCYDYDVWGDKAEQVYECITVGEGAHTVGFSVNCWKNVARMWYSMSCMHASDLFGCYGVRSKQYCILNKQYTKEEYETLVPKLIAHMQKTGEWGEFFPMSLSEFGYNETVAQEYFPLTKEEVVKRGWNWKEEEKRTLILPEKALPDTIGEVQENLVQEILQCAQCTKNYKIIPQELAFYMKNALPVPDRCQECRHKNRMQKKNSRRLHERSCGKCGKGIETTYAEGKQEGVYCATCYEEEVY